MEEQVDTTSIHAHIFTTHTYTATTLDDISITQADRNTIPTDTTIIHADITTNIMDVRIFVELSPSHLRGSNPIYILNILLYTI